MSRCVGNYSACLLGRFNIFGSIENLESAIRSLEESIKDISNNKTLEPRFYINLAGAIWRDLFYTKSVIGASNLLVNMLRWNEACNISVLAVRVFSKANSRYLPRDDQEDIIRQFSSLAASAFSLTLETSGDAAQAFQILELGRGIISSWVISSRSDLQI